MLQPSDDYRTLRESFAWNVPEFYNIGVDVCDRQVADGRDVALMFVEENGTATRWRFDDVRRLSNRLANAFLARGIARGDRIGICLPQSPETLVAHVAAFKAGCISVPLFTLFGDDALAYRLFDSGARAIVTDAAGWEKLGRIRARLPDLKTAFVVGGTSGGDPGYEDFSAALSGASDAFAAVNTRADDPALIIYTSGTTGSPKGTLHAHRVLLGHLPGVELSHEFFPQSEDLFWTPADWAWIGGLIDVLLPSLHHGVPVLAHRARKFDAAQAYDLMATHRVRNVFLPPTALKLMRQSDARVPPSLRLRTIASGGEPLGAELLDWGRRTFGVAINEFYGQTECNMVVCNAASVFPVRAGSMGRAVPGHDVRVVDADGSQLPAGCAGTIGIRRPDPVMFLEYWRNAAATAEKFAGDFLLTGDLGHQDEDGYLWFQGRSDDIITSAGYRIGPVEIEECLLKHRAVAMAAVVGAPDPIRTQVVKAFVVLKIGEVASAELRSDITDFVKTRLAAHEYPRILEFVTELPLTNSGKIIRRELRDRDG
ncbi:MAG: acyl-CoA synthetase [Candidatus Velthaea sp.]